MHYAHSHNVNLIQSTSSSITNLMASTETIASGAEPGRSKYAKKSRKRQKRRRKRNWTSFRVELTKFSFFVWFSNFCWEGKKNLKYCSYYVGRWRWPGRMWWVKSQVYKAIDLVQIFHNFSPGMSPPRRQIFLANLVTNIYLKAGSDFWFIRARKSLITFGLEAIFFVKFDFIKNC